MTHKNSIVGPYKHSDELDYLDPNLVYRALKLDDVFAEHDYNLVLENPELYEFDRYEPRNSDDEYHTWLNMRHTLEYTDNLLFLRKTKKVQQIEPEFNLRYSKIIRDRAQVTIYYNIRKQLLSASEGKSSAYEIYNRFFIIQGAIGVGKTTMLRYFAKQVFSKALQVDFPQKKQVVFFVDLQSGFSPGETPSRKDISKRIKEKILVEFPDLLSADNLKAINKEEFLRNKTFIEISKKPDDIRRKIMSECKDDNIFVIRSLAYLSSIGYCVVLVLDNCDLYPHKTQINIFGYLNRLLYDVPKMFGIITLREYTLNELGHLKSMDAFYHLKTLHMTTASIQGMLKKRFEYAANLIEKTGKAPELMLRNRKDLTFTMESYREFLTKWSRCLLEDITVGWILQLTNRDMREAMRIVKGVICSANMDIIRIISAFYKNEDLFNKKRRGKPWTYTIKPDEFLRLLMLSNKSDFTSTIYKESDESLVQNIFNLNDELPKPFRSGSNRFPFLIKYRAMEYFVTRKWRRKDTFLRHFSVYGYSKGELNDLLQWLVNYYFLESKEGLNISKIKTLMATRKLSFYLHKFTKFIIYQENIRNDVYLTYSNPAHQHNTEMIRDILQLFRFYEEIMKYEFAENAFMVRYKNMGYLTIYTSSILGRMPISWKLLKGCRNRMIELAKPISRKSDGQINTLIREFNCLREKILSMSQNRELRPRITTNIKNRCRPLSFNDFDNIRLSLRKKT